MKTSYYMSAVLRAGRESGKLAIVQISQGLPRWKYCQPDYNLAGITPEYDRHAGHAPDELRRQYRTQLDEYGLANIRADFEDLASIMREDGSNAEPVLCCHEKDGATCHRRWFAEWWREQTGEDIRELELAERAQSRAILTPAPKREAKPAKPAQPSAPERFNALSTL